MRTVAGTTDGVTLAMVDCGALMGATGVVTVGAGAGVVAAAIP